MTEQGWLIEQKFNGRGVWWRGILDSGRDWTTDANEAVRFARKIDAERVLRSGVMGVFWKGAAATDHLWDDGDVPRIRIIVNGLEFLVEEKVTYEQIVELAGKRGNPTVTYSTRRKGDSRRSGEMHQGCNPVQVEEGMMFNAMHTGNA